ncbi:VWA domain-containing protein [Candidatus Pacearchaeota archaeon]|nr:VWA domain-containing protein [Candidatus Pacearchaeota archaeon]
MEIIFRNAFYLWFLLAIILLIALHFTTLKYIKRRALKFANFEAIERVTGSEIFSKNVLLLYIRLLIVICVILAAAGTTVWYTGKSSNVDYVLAIDASSSMLAQDIMPNRLETAKDSAIAFVDSLKARTEIAVVSFSGSSFVEQELTSDLLNVKNAIRGIEVKYVGGTDILDAVVTSVSVLFKGKNLKAVILLTDGQINVGTIDEIIDYARKNAVTIHTIGLGTVSGGKMQIGDIGFSSELDEDALKSIAYNTGGGYNQAKNKDELLKAYKEITSTTNVKLSFNASATLLFIALFLLLIEWFLINTRYRTLP